MLILLLKKISYLILLIFLLSFFSYLLLYFYDASKVNFFSGYFHFIEDSLKGLDLIPSTQREHLYLPFLFSTSILFFSVISFTFFIGFPIGIYLGLLQNTTINFIFHLFLLFCYSIPILFLGLIVFIQLFPHYFNELVQLKHYHYLADSDYYFNDNYKKIAYDTFYGAWLPILILSLQPCAMMIHLVAKRVQIVLNFNFIRFEKVQKNATLALTFKHIIPNTLPYSLKRLLNYTTLILFFTMCIELIFNLNGAGKVVYHAFFIKNVKVIAMFILFSGIFVGIFELVCHLLMWIFFPAERRKLQ